MLGFNTSKGKPYYFKTCKSNDFKGKPCKKYKAMHVRAMHIRLRH
jgi:hypothetical protein